MGLPVGTPAGESVPPARESTSPAQRSIGQRVRAAIDVLEESARRGEQRGLGWPIYAGRVIVNVLLRAWDRCPQQAASLAFQTALSIVPMIAIALALLRATGEFEAESTLVAFLAREVLPSASRDDIASHLLSFAGNMSFQATGLVGMGTTMLLAFLMYRAVETIFNDIWRVERRRKLGQLFVTFYAMVTMVPALFAISLYHAARHGLTEGVLGSLYGLAASFTGLLMANKMLPATRVRWSAAAAGALFTALSFEVAKHGFQLYVAKVAFASYAGVYGALGLVPILLLWIYYTWLVVLLGAEIAHGVQNLHHLEGVARRGGERTRTDRLSGQVGARFLCAIVAEWRAGGRATTRAALADRFGVSEDLADQVLRRLRVGGLVLEIDGDATGYLPARPPADVTLDEVLAVFRGADVAAPRPPGAPASRLDVVLAEVDEATRGRARGVTIDELARG
jgi:membrane protein